MDVVGGCAGGRRVGVSNFTSALFPVCVVSPHPAVKKKSSKLGFFHQTPVGDLSFSVSFLNIVTYSRQIKVQVVDV